MERRRVVLTSAAEINLEQADELAKLLTLAMGRPIAQAKGDVAMVASIYQYYSDHVEEYMADERLDTAVVRTELIALSVRWGTRSAAERNQRPASVPSRAGCGRLGFARERY
ncbi:aldehyde dehydrogenase family protein [Arthrobacter sp. Y81]|uniref:aldehyde dehydrogenase family protein n=1 Tax=Arthrobacter sp. Y81 TaxID=2058897 RepID=UPI001CA4D0A4|nr:aldehyde dehydrogenase family protein [Arthrobacter sp. Y81]